MRPDFPYFGDAHDNHYTSYHHKSLVRSPHASPMGRGFPIHAVSLWSDLGLAGDQAGSTTGRPADCFQNACGFYGYLRQSAVSPGGHVRADAGSDRYAIVRQPGRAARFLRFPATLAILPAGSVCPHDLHSRHQYHLRPDWHRAVCAARRKYAGFYPAGIRAAARFGIWVVCGCSRCLRRFQTAAAGEYGAAQGWIRMKPTSIYQIRVKGYLELQGGLHFGKREGAFYIDFEFSRIDNLRQAASNAPPRAG